MIELDMNLFVSFMWLCLSAGALLPGIWLLIDGKTNLPMINMFFERLYLFGKLKNENGVKKHILFDIPKSYFLHFYIVGLLVNIPLFFFYGLSSVLCIMLIHHTSQRLYECIFTHKFGPNSRISIIHYLIGIFYYPFAGLTIIIDNIYGHETIPRISYYISIGLFLFASRMQHNAHLILAKADRKKDENYPIPNGYWAFDYFSCPNYIAEILVYIAFLIISNRTSCFMSMTIWVIANQSITALLAHRWYRQHYGETYPSQRAALIPFIL